MIPCFLSINLYAWVHPFNTARHMLGSIVDCDETSKSSESSIKTSGWIEMPKVVLGAQIVLSTLAGSAGSTQFPYVNTSL